MGYLPLTLISMVSLGVYYFLVKIISVHVNSTVILFVGNIVISVVLFIYLNISKTPIIPKRRIYIVYSFLVAMPLVIALITIYVAIVRGPVSVVMPIYVLNAMVTALLGIVVLREKVSTQRIFGLVLAISAIVLLSL
jgi:transporter family protein